MAARLEPDAVQRMRQSLQHLVAKAPWSYDGVLEWAREQVLPAMQKNGPVVVWIVDDTGFLKKGTHSVGVAHQYCGQLGKQANCRVAVSLSVATRSSSLPIGYRLYLPTEWAADSERREKAEVPEEVEFQTKPEIALDQIRAAVAAKLARGTVLADAFYGINTEFRDGLSELGLPCMVGVQSTMTVWGPGQQPLPAKPRGSMGRPPRLLRRSRQHQPVPVKQFFRARYGRSSPMEARQKAGSRNRQSAQSPHLKVAVGLRAGPVQPSLRLSVTIAISYAGEFSRENCFTEAASISR